MKTRYPLRTLVVTLATAAAAICFLPMVFAAMSM